MKGGELIKITNVDEFIENCFGLWIDSIFHGIVNCYPGHTMDEYRDAFLGLLRQWLEEGRICLFAPWCLRQPNGTFDTGVRKIPRFDEIWDIPHDEMIAWTRDSWPRDVNDEDDSVLNSFFFDGNCPGIGWFDLESGELFAS